MLEACRPLQSFGNAITEFFCISSISSRIPLLRYVSLMRFRKLHFRSAFWAIGALLLLFTLSAFLTEPIRKYPEPPPARVQAVLHDHFSMPHSVLRAVPDAQAYKLLILLQKLNVRDPRLLILHTIGDDAIGRFEAISTALAYSINTNRALLVLWDVANGGTKWGYNPLPVGKNFVFVTVNDFLVDYGERDWAELNTLYLAQRHESSLDHVVAVSSRHIFIRAKVKLKIKYGPLSLGVTALHDALSKEVEPESAIFPAWTSFIQPWIHPEDTREDVETELHRTYNVPYVFLENMDDRKRRLLLHELAKSALKRVIFVHAQYGLGNRLRALGSAMALANETKHVLVLIWVPDAHLNCTFNDLFSNDMIVLDKLSLKWPPHAMHKNDPAMRHVDFFNFMREANGQHIHNPNTDRINPNPNRHVYVKSAYVIKSKFTPNIISTTSAFWNIMRENLIPIPWIMDLVHDPGLKSIRDMIGVHIRSRTIKDDIKGIGVGEYGKSAETTDYWRRVTGLQTFVSKMRKLSSKQKFFIAADTQEAIQLLQKEFGTNRIRALRRSEPCEMRDSLCVRLALADIMCLSRTKLILGSHWSSFTETAVRLSGGTKALLAGVHFGRPRR